MMLATRKSPKKCLKSSSHYLTLRINKVSTLSLFQNKYSECFFISFMITIPKLYSLSNAILMSMYAGLSFLILVALNKIPFRKLSPWYVKAFVVSFCLLPMTNFELSASFWIGWIFLICFAVLSQQSRFKL